MVHIMSCYFSFDHDTVILYLYVISSAIKKLQNITGKCAFFFFLEIKTQIIYILKKKEMNMICLHLSVSLSNSRMLFILNNFM